MDKKVIHRVFEKMAAVNPLHIAVDDGTYRLTYADLNRQANRLAHLLRAVGCSKGTIINVLVPSSIQTIISMLSIFKSGGIYLPMDLSFSPQRMEQIFRGTFNGILIVTQAAKEDMLGIMKKLGINSCRLIVLDGMGDAGLHEVGEKGCTPADLASDETWEQDPDVEVRGEDSNYIFYTSGSTGAGKPIVGAHASLSHFIHWEIGEFDIDQTFRVSQLAQTTFDAILREVFVALISGGTLYIPPADVKSNPAHLMDWICRSEITIMHCVPSLFRVLTRELSATSGEGKDKHDLRHLKYILMGGEILYARDILNWREKAGDNITLVNIYGATETTLIKTFHRIGEVQENPSQIIPVGKPISNTTIAIIKDDRICRIGESGEIYIKTPFASKGYYNDPVLTATCFVQNPLEKEKRDIVYRTGDLGRYLPDGNVEVLGRLDNQAKINGVRVELGEVERAMLRQDNVTECVVTVYRSDDNLSSLIAYYTGERIEEQRLRQSLSLLLNTQIIPSYFVYLDEFPLNMNGKIDKRSLPVPEEVIMGGVNFQEPMSELEMTLADIWKELLGLKRVGRNISFFTIGGHSLRAIQLTARIEKKLGVNIKIADVFLYDTIQELAIFISRNGKQIYRPIPQYPEQPDYPLSPSQRRIWILSQFRESNIAYNISDTYIFEGGLDPDAFDQALRMLVARHDSLRTVFREDHLGNIRQQVLPAVEASFRLIRQDLHNSPDIEGSLRSLIREARNEAFDLAATGLIRARLYQLGDQRWAFAYTMHHIISDHLSMAVLIKELLFIYNALAEGITPELPPLRIQYKDYTLWQHEQLQDAMNDHKTYWLGKLEGHLPILSLPLDKPRPAYKTFNGDIAGRTISTEALSALKDLLREQDATLFMGLLALVKTLLFRYTGQQDLIVGSPVAGRAHWELEDQIGLYLNTLALRTRLEESDSYLDLLGKVKTTTLEAYDHQLYPLDDLLDALQLQRDMSRSALFDVLIDLHDIRGLEKDQHLGNVKVSMYKDIQHVVSKFDLTFMFMESDAGLYLALEYNTDLFERATIQRMCDHLEQLLQSVVALPEAPIVRVDYISEPERAQLLDVFGRSEMMEVAGRDLLSLIRDQARLHPEAVALRQGSRSLSYKELDEQSGRLAGYLLNEGGMKRGDQVGILMDRSMWMITGIVGIWKAGGAYVPVDPDYPRARKEFIVQDAGLKILLTTTDHIFDLDYYTGTIIALDVLNSEYPALSHDELIDPHQLAYVIYTSGSTGMPKGCGITHGNLSNYVGWANGYYFQGDKPASFGLYTSLSFDLTVTSIFCTLTQGGVLRIYEQTAELSEVLEDSFGEGSGIDSIKLTPSHISYMKHLGLRSGTMHRAIVGGEQVTEEHVRILKEINPGIEIYNEYGPTETTVGCVVAQLSEGLPVVIGRPIAGTRVYVLTEEGELCPVGVAGEICIGGAGADGLEVCGRSVLRRRPDVPDG